MSSVQALDRVQCTSLIDLQFNGKGTCEMLNDFLLSPGSNKERQDR